MYIIRLCYVMCLDTLIMIHLTDHVTPLKQCTPNDNNIITDLDNAITSFVFRLCHISNRTLEYGYMLLVKVNDKETYRTVTSDTV